MATLGRDTPLLAVQRLSGATERFHSGRHAAVDHSLEDIPEKPIVDRQGGGEGGIRTHEGRKPLAV